MTNIIFITHPATIIDPHVPTHQWAISDQGFAEIQALLTKEFWGEVDIMYSSSELKATSVAEICAKKYGLSLVIEDDLAEIDRSSTGYLPFREYLKGMESFYGHPDTSYQGWETARHASNRMVSCVERIMGKHQNQTVAIIGHGATGTLLACWVQSIAPSFVEDPKTIGCIMHIDWDHKTIISPWEKY